jgi:hypothetical protein
VHAMQYRIVLPADYDMEIIRTRVRTRGHATDDFPGLALKAYLVRERGVDGSPVNAYAPFYVWNDTAGLGRFLWGGGGFGPLVADFGRPTVHSWIGAGAMAGPARGSVPAVATLHTEPLGHGADPAETMARAQRELALRAATPGVHTAVAALDPHHWELLQATLWEREAPPEQPGERYRLLHLSSPGLDRLSPTAPG